MAAEESNATELYAALQACFIDHHFAHFVACGITSISSLRCMSMHEYGKYGVIHPQERTRLFQLIQELKKENRSDKTAAKLYCTSQEKQQVDKKRVSLSTKRESLSLSKRESFSGQNLSTVQPLLLSPPAKCVSASPQRVLSSFSKRDSLSKSEFSLINEQKDSLRTRVHSSFSPLSKAALGDKGNLERIKVYVRKRPLTKKEVSRGDIDVVHIVNSSEPRSLLIREPKYCGF